MYIACIYELVGVCVCARAWVDVTEINYSSYCKPFIGFETVRPTVCVKLSDVLKLISKLI